MFDRLVSLIGTDNLEKIQRKHVLLVGVGGVGGFALESLVRSGFKNITIIDGDTIHITNLNRQIITNTNNIGEEKAVEAKNRALSINPNININAINTFLTKENISDYLNENYDYIIDACDDIPIKLELIKYAVNNNIKIITCLGAGKKLNPTKLEITTLNKTFNDPLAKKLRYEIKKENIPLNIPVVFSSEEVVNKDKVIASAIFVPACAGIMLANYVFNDIIKPQE